MKKIGAIVVFLFVGAYLSAQGNAPANDGKENGSGYKKRVLETTEINLLTSFYTQDGDNAAVTGGIGTEKLNDFATNINVSIPLNDDDVLTIDGTISAYTSASSSNLNPFTGASRSGREGSRHDRWEDDDDDDDDDDHFSGGNNIGSPWVASSGASRSDVWKSISLAYSHTSDDRNTMWSGHLSAAREYDYGSVAAGVALSRQFNQKNTEASIGANLYLDQWYPQYPTEIHTFLTNGGNLNADYFSGVDILNQNGVPVNKTGTNVWRPLNSYLLTTDKRNTYSVSLSFSQIVNRNSQFSIFADLIFQNGWLSNPMQRVYFSDRANYYIGNASSINNYDQPSNRDVFQLADDIERLPDTRMKIPIGLRYHYYLNEKVVIRSYYRYYFDDWGVQAHTIHLELPVKVGDHFTLYPNYRYYVQTAASYFAPYERHLSTETYYTSDYDLSAFHSSQYGIGIGYADILTRKHLWRLGLKNISLNYNLYLRSTGLTAHLLSLGVKFVIDK